MYHGSDPLQLARVSNHRKKISSFRDESHSWRTQRWGRTSPRSTQGRRPSMFRVVFKSTSRLACAIGYVSSVKLGTFAHRKVLIMTFRYVPAPPERSSGPTRSSLEKAEQGITGQKAVRVLFLLVIAFCSRIARRPCKRSDQSIPMVCVNAMQNFPALSEFLDSLLV
jgi:hypothetical protein